jgi:hypothetical protein
MTERGMAKECEVVLAFLKAEVDSDRYAPIILSQLPLFRLSRHELIDNADLRNAQHNAYRSMLLNYRGYLQRESLFRGFPIDVQWRRADLEPRDLRHLKYLNEPNWMRFSEQTRQPARVADRINKGELGEDPGRRVLAIQEKLRRGEQLPELIAAESVDDDALILIEGNSRATAYCGLNWQKNVPLFLASSPEMKHWAFY